MDNSLNSSLNFSKTPFWWIGYVPAALLALLVSWLLIYVGAPILIPLLLSFALAFMLEPIADFFQRRGNSRNTAVLIALALAVVTTLLVFVVLLPGVYSQLRESIEKLPLAVRAVNGQLQNLLNFAHERLSPAVFAQLQNFINGFQEDPSAITSRIGTYLSQGLFGLVNLGSATVGLLIVPFFVYYLLLDMQNIREFIENRIPERHRGAGKRLFDETGVVVRGYVRGRIIIALILSAFYALGLFLLGVPLWAAIGLIAGVVGIIPYIGIIVGLVLAIGFALLNGASVFVLIGVVVVFVLAQPLEDYVLTPKFIGSKLDLHPMLVFISLIIAGSLFGLLGLVLAIPVVGIIRVFLKFFDELYVRSDFYLQPALAEGETPGATAVQRAARATASDQKAASDAAAFEATREKTPAKK